MLRASQGLFPLGKFLYLSCTLWINAQLCSLLQYDCLANLAGLNATCWAFLYGFVFPFNEQSFRRIKLDAGSSNGVFLQLFLLAVNTFVPMRHQLDLTCTKDEHYVFNFLTVEHRRWLFRKRFDDFNSFLFLFSYFMFIMSNENTQIRKVIYSQVHGSLVLETHLFETFNWISTTRLAELLQFWQGRK